MSRIVFYWLPRILAILFIAFISMFALYVFREGGSPMQIAIALFPNAPLAFGAGFPAFFGRFIPADMDGG